MQRLAMSVFTSVALVVCTSLPSVANVNPNFDQLRRENLDKDAVDFDVLRRENLDKGAVDFDVLRRENLEKDAVSLN